MFLLSVKLQADTKLLCWSLFEELRGADVSSDLQDKDFKVQWFIRDQLSVEHSWSHRRSFTFHEMYQTSQNRKREEIKVKETVHVDFLFLYGGDVVSGVFMNSFSKNSFITDPRVSDCRSDEPERPLSARSALRSDSAAENLQQHDQLSRPEQTNSESEVKRSVVLPHVVCFYCLYINCLLLIEERETAQRSILEYQVINCWTGNSDTHTDFKVLLLDLCIRTSYFVFNLI